VLSKQLKNNNFEQIIVIYKLNNHLPIDMFFILIFKEPRLKSKMQYVIMNIGIVLSVLVQRIYGFLGKNQTIALTDKIPLYEFP